jgi:4-hydroxybenzoate polyprenyltransferase
VKIRALWRLLRPKQWSKGLLVFAAVLFTRSADQGEAVRASVLIFLAIGLVSSATYIFNDLVDAERDRLHPKKRLRPIAAGEVSRALAAVIALICLAAGLAIAFAVRPQTLYVIGAYLLLQGLYNGALKRMPVADVFVISLGFVLRAVLGAVAINVQISGWLLFCTGALALLLGFGKRRHEFILQGEDRSLSRESLGTYTRHTLDAFCLISAAGAALCYGVYSIESPTAQKYPGLILTSLFVFYGIYRYVFVIFNQGEGEEPETLLFRDPHIVFSVVLFILAAMLAMSGVRVPVLESFGGGA